MGQTPDKVPWGRIAIEGIVIVASILLAFAIDASWQNRGERAEEREILQALHRDFDTNRAAAEDVQRTHRDEGRDYARLASMTVDEVLALPPDSVTVFQVGLAGPYTFDPVRGTLDALIGAGKLSLIRDRVLRGNLVSFLNLVDDAEEDAAFMGQAAATVWNAMLKYGGPWARPQPEGREVIGDQGEFLDLMDAQTLARLRADPMLMGQIKLFRSNAAIYAGEVARIGAVIDSILVRLEGVVDRP